jgi:putative membrane protein
MRIVRTILWLLLTVVLVLFAVANWNAVEVAIGGGLELDTRLPVLVIGAFVLGLVPMWIVHRTVLWRMRRRLRELTAMQATMVDGGEDEAADRFAHLDGFEAPPRR